MRMIKCHFEGEQNNHAIQMVLGGRGDEKRKIRAESGTGWQERIQRARRMNGNIQPFKLRCGVTFRKFQRPSIRETPRTLYGYS